MYPGLLCTLQPAIGIEFVLSLMLLDDARFKDLFVLSLLLYSNTDEMKAVVIWNLVGCED